MSVSMAFYGALLKLLKEYGIHDAVEVTGFEEEEVSTGYCETCYYEYTVVDITYVTETGAKKVHRYTGSFVDLIQSLL